MIRTRPSTSVVMSRDVKVAIDSHVHVVDTHKFVPPRGPGYRPTAADQGSAEGLRGTLAANGLDAAVVVQLSGYGTDNACLLDALAQSGGRWRGIASLPPDVGDDEIDRLDRSGVVGVRFNVANLGAGALDGQERLLAVLAERRWVAQVQCPAPELPALSGLLHPERGPVLLDHLGLPDPARGVDDPGFRSVLEFGARGAFLKLSGAFRCTRSPFPHPDLDAFVEPLLRAFPPTRRVWGSDWPFVGLSVRPDYATTLATLARWLPDAAERELAMCKVPRALYRL